MTYWRKRLLVSLLVACLGSPLLASDLAKEKRWADQIVDSLLDGEAVWLKTGNHSFLSIYTSAKDESLNKALIVMHGTGVHPNWDQVIRPLRVALTEYGWNTLSIQMPVLANDADHDDYAVLFPEVVPRINAALSYLKSQGAEDIVLIGHSLGSLMTSYYLSRENDESIKGFVAIGMPGGSEHDAMNSLRTLKAVKGPVFDLFGSQDLPEVLSNRQQKKKIAEEAGNNDYRQLQVENANHFFDDREEALVKAVSDWLATRR
ncbi:MAG: alpha/beta hydrolase family protein [Gammaproteobacteria bacterium]|nr:alpha/beta hydrolase family protein [Gammaproteobacteria bacterium]